jgi:hypothetical protein
MAPIALLWTMLYPDVQVCRTEKDESLIEESGLTDDFSDDPTVLKAKFPQLFMRFWQV